MCFKFILHFRILSISLYMYDFSVRSRSVMGSACLSVYAILPSHDSTLRDIRIKEHALRNDLNTIMQNAFKT